MSSNTTQQKKEQWVWVKEIKNDLIVQYVNENKEEFNNYMQTQLTPYMYLSHWTVEQEDLSTHFLETGPAYFLFDNENCKVLENIVKEINK